MSDKPSGLLARWNLRRQQVQAEEEAEAVAPSTAEENETLSQEPALDSTEQAIEGGEKLLTAEDLPDPEKIEVGGSFASFMANKGILSFLLIPVVVNVNNALILLSILVILC